MTQIRPDATPSTSQVRTDPRIDAPRLARLSQALQAEPARPGDGAAKVADPRAQALRLSTRIAGLEKQVFQIHALDDALHDISKLIDELEQKQGAATAQDEVDSIVASINDAAERAGLGSGGAARATDVLEGFEVLSIDGSLRAGPEVPVDVEVVEPATDPGLFLSFGGSELDLGQRSVSDSDGRLFSLEIAGTSGTTRFSFASGMTIQDIASAINSVAGQTGVDAVAENPGPGTSGVRLSGAPGSESFVSVRIIDAGGLQDPDGSAGIFNVEDGVRTPFEEATTFAQRSVGSDLVALVNGRLAAADGGVLTANVAGVNVSFSVSAGAQNNAGLVRAFTLSGDSAFSNDASLNPLGSRLDTSFLGALDSPGGIEDARAGLAEAQNVTRTTLGDLKSEIRTLLDTQAPAPADAPRDALTPQRTAELLRMELFKNR